jgi:peptidoglycan/LPS O-acetylase OafA/YrhL
MLVTRNVLPGVFSDNPLPHVVNGSLWTLPVEFLCYISVAVLGSVKFMPKNILIGSNLLLVVLLSTYASLIVGTRFSPHFEMLAIFWFGVFYGHCLLPSQSELKTKRLGLILVVFSIFIFLLLGPRGVERFAMLCFSAIVVHFALKCSLGSKLTDHIGDLSYGVYIFAFPVQQIVVNWGKEMNYSFLTLFVISLFGTMIFAYASWHFIEQRVLRFKPKRTST